MKNNYILHINLRGDQYDRMAADPSPKGYTGRALSPHNLKLILADGKGRKLPDEQLLKLAASPADTNEGIQAGTLIPRTRRIIFHRGYTRIQTEALLTGLRAGPADTVSGGAICIRFVKDPGQHPDTGYRDRHGLPIHPGDRLLHVPGQQKAREVVRLGDGWGLAPGDYDLSILKTEMLQIVF